MLNRKTANQRETSQSAVAHTLRTILKDSASELTNIVVKPRPRPPTAGSHHPTMNQFYSRPNHKILKPPSSLLCVFQNKSKLSTSDLFASNRRNIRFSNYTWKPNSQKKTEILNSQRELREIPIKKQATLFIEAKRPDENEVHLGGRIEDYIIGSEIGKGAYAIVKSAVHRQSRKRVALKIYDKHTLTSGNKEKTVEREIRVLSKIHHPNIVKLYDSIENSTQWVLVLENIAGASLHTLLKRRQKQKFSESDARTIFSPIITALEYCHSQGISHRDIKFDNIIIDNYNNVKIIDFGFATWSTTKTTTFCGTPSYMAPEIVARREYFSPPTDVWACGVLLFGLLAGYFPFHGSSDQALYNRIIKGTFVVPETLSAVARQLLYKMLHPDPSSRITANQVLEDPWLTTEGAFRRHKNY